MPALTPERARALLGGSLDSRAEINGHDLLAGHANRDGLTLITTPSRAWSRTRRDRRGREPHQARPGSRLIDTGAVLLFLLGAGLLAVSFAAQYQYVLRERHHQHVASLIEAGALDVGLIIFSLLALGLARAGLTAKVERAAVMGCAAGSAVMNYAAADVTSPRSVLAYCMPPVFLAFVVDRVVRTVQRHVLGMSDARSPWAVLADGVRRVARSGGLAVLYALRFLVDRRNTCTGLKQAILNATPLPEGTAHPAAQPGAARHCPEPGASPRPDHPGPQRPRRPERNPQRPRPATKTARFLDLVRIRHGELAAIPLDQVSRIATAIAAEADLHPASARTALLNAVRAALPAGEGDVR